VGPSGQPSPPPHGDVAPKGRRARVGVDVGGTFTDIAVLDPDRGDVSIYKVPTTPADPSVGVLEGLAYVASETGGEFSTGSIEHFLHGTTITTNALIQRSFPPCALLITEGHRGAVQVQDQQRRGNVYDLTTGHPDSLVDELHVFEVPERTDHEGNVVVALDAPAVEAIAAQVQALGISSVAVCLLFSFANPSHEEAVRRIFREVCPDVSVSLSSEVLPRIREWPRISTMLLNASLEPLLVAYVRRLADALGGSGLGFDRLFLMESNGGLMPFSAVIVGHRAVQTLLSGPAAAVQGAVTIARRGVEGTLVTLDIGGTSADIAFVGDEGALEITEGHLVGHDIYVPMLDVTTIGAGGGTISRLAEDGRLLVGPDSAGADPGPACYGRGGVDPTTTDADLVLGFLNPTYYLGGRMTIDPRLAEEAIATRIAGPLGLSVAEAAATMIRVNDVHMAEAIRVFAAQRGVDVLDATLVPCGGAGPLHAAGVAEEIGMRSILVPATPGAFSAVGLLSTDIVQDFVQSEITLLVGENAALVDKRFEDLSAVAVAEMVAQGFAPGEVLCQREVDARYAGQGFEIRISVPEVAAEELPAAIGERFHEGHRRTYGYIAEHELIEIVSYRVRAVVTMPKYAPSPVAARPEGEGAPAPSGRREVYVHGGWETSAVIERAALAPGDRLAGPLIVEQPDTTTFVPPGWTMRCDEFANLVLSREES